MKKSLVKELQRLAKNLANIETNNNNAVGVLYELNNALTGQLLPPPSAEDVGKVPTVQEDGSYALANAQRRRPHIQLPPRSAPLRKINKKT